MHVILCELGCNQEIARGATHDEAEEAAAEANAYHDTGDEGSGDWCCAECVHKYYVEGMQAAAGYDREQRIHDAIEDDAAWRDEMLARADLIFDTARDRGEI